MKVRFGIGLGPLGPGDDLAAIVDRLEELRLDSLWFSEQVAAPVVDPVVGQAFAVARTTRLRVGSGVGVLPGRHPVLVAKQLASLAALAPGRVLPVFGLQPARAPERAWFPVPEGRRGDVVDESLALVRRLLTEERVTHRGEFFTLDDAAVATIRQAAAEAGREVDPEHFGLSLPVAAGEPDERLLRSIAGRRPGLDPRSLVPSGWAEARRVLAAHVDAGLSKFVVRPASPPASWPRWIDEFAAELTPLQT
ncbi:LLM class flavin-dependent oxidoreductase [Trujillonella humicola]|uniref:LLM class flavin-dependent oxidoreductase n=1 Tax=Trujillonella humicola TaxID=3383699 RepID=UPI0039060682